MTLDITPIKWIIGAIAFLIIFAGACYFWYQHDTAPYRQESSETTELARQWELTQKADTESKSDQASDVISAQGTTPTAEKTVTGTPSDVKNTEAETEQPSDTPAENAEAKDGLVSPFGYGPYPDVPDDYREARGEPIWEHPKWPDGIALPEGAELLARVLIKAWKKGIRDYEGASHQIGKVRINYPNTLYIWYGESYEDADGTIVRPIRRSKGDPNVQLTRDEMRRGIVPSGVRILDGETDAIDVFEYLSLTSK